MTLGSVLRMAIWVNLIPHLLVFSLGRAEPPRQIAQKTFPSVVLLVMEDTNGQPVSLGSGFFVRGDIVTTNLHVIEGASRGYAKIVGQKAKYEIAGTVGIDRQRDLVLLKIIGAKAPSLSLGDSRRVSVGDEVYAVGNPQGLEGTFSQGIISGVRQVGAETLFQITAPISPGSSGGPILNAEAKVIGVAVAAFKDGQNLNFAIPASYLESLLADLQPVSPLPKTKKDKKEKTILDGLGGRSTEGVVGSHFTWTDNITGHYNFSVRNQLRQAVKDVSCLIIFYGTDGLPIETEVVLIEGPIGASLAKRSGTIGRIFPGEVKALTKKVEIRILDFQLVE